MQQILIWGKQICQHKEGTVNELLDPAKNLPRTIQVNDGTDTRSNIHPPQLAKQITARRTPNAGAVFTPHVVITKWIKYL